jgi:8-oxo-(d)GTP phosphatase
MTTVVAAAGGVLWRPANGGVDVAVVHRPRYDDWSLPKGKLDDGETTHAAAVREIAEETGFAAVLGRHVGTVRYPVERPRPATKTVDYFAARAGAGSFRRNDEVDELRWCPVAAARDLLTYQHDRDVLAAFAALPAELTTLLLVRHAKAGRRGEWAGPDELRPLSEHGWRQAAAIRALVPLFGVDRVHSAPLLRCQQTIEAVAADLTVPVTNEPLLSEGNYRDRTAEAATRLTDIAADGGIAVVCSQGGVIPGLVSTLATTGGLDLTEVESRKGSVWALFFHGDKLIAADYTLP